MSKIAEVSARLEAEGVTIAGPGGERIEPDEVEETSTVGALENGDAISPNSDAPPDDVSSAASANTPAAKPSEAAKPKAPEDDRAAAKFAALSRQKAENLRIIETAETKSRDVATRETALAAKEAELEKALASPDEIFAQLEKRFGVKTLEDLQKYAAKAWERPKSDAEKPLTAAEVQAMLARERETAAVEARKAATYEKFVALTDDDTKYDAASLIFSPAERIREGDRIANELTRLGEAWTLDDIADAVNELARQDLRYAKIQKRGGASSAGATKTASVASQQGNKGARIPTASDAGERASGATNGEARMSRKERLEMLAKRLEKTRIVT